MGYLDMPTVFRGGGFRVVIWSADHRPPHVHIFVADGEVIIEIESLDVLAAFRVSRRDMRRAVQIVESNREAFRSEWRRIHGG